MASVVYCESEVNCRSCGGFVDKDNVEELERSEGTGIKYLGPT